MAIRKIPLKEHSYVTDGGSATSKEADERPIDPQVESSIFHIRQAILADRAIHDKVGINLLPAYPN
jgi:ATP-dependent RNA helicase DDX55/SPB4